MTDTISTVETVITNDDLDSEPVIETETYEDYEVCLLYLPSVNKHSMHQQIPGSKALIFIANYCRKMLITSCVMNACSFSVCMHDSVCLSTYFNSITCLNDK